jgi:hypothetical protein
VTVTKTLSYAKAATGAAPPAHGADQALVDSGGPAHQQPDHHRPAGRHRSRRDAALDLDAPQPQVEIEARIVRTTKDFAKDLGIRGGFGAAAPELGNTTRWPS